MNKIIEALINIIFLGFGNKLKGYRTIIVNVVAALIMLAEFITGNVHTFFCESLKWQCEASFWAVIAGSVTTLNMILRYVTNTDAGRASKF